MTLTEVIHARGHVNVKSTHKKTLEITREDHLTPRGDCIIAVKADKGLNELGREFMNALKSGNAVLELTIKCNGVKDTVKAMGHPDLTLDHPTDMVVRKSSYTCSRTLAVKADKAAVDLDRRLVEELARDNSKVKVTLKVVRDD